MDQKLSKEFRSINKLTKIKPKSKLENDKEITMADR